MNHNHLEPIPPLQMKYPKKIFQFFHCLNIMMGNTFFICHQQAIQYALINIRKVGYIEKALCKNKMFDIDNFIGGFRTLDCKNYKLRNFDNKTFNQIMNKNLLKGEILKYLDTQNTTPILVQVIDGDNEDYLVIKRINKFWFYFNQKGQIFQICDNVSYQIPDLQSQIEQIDQKYSQSRILVLLMVFTNQQSFKRKIENWTKSCSKCYSKFMREELIKKLKNFGMNLPYFHINRYTKIN
ncbi:hypothetical protein OXYTRIMIC_739 [Oxytricha trifallax]|uniref:Uncharacterized protein n=1 Tax=Oxytricha trifallax TaxID=1172189 RepID=A0A073HZU7_9SPIT|nr:hypothetical protein OXYTRIMIC_739 [Oxytricha trifallax]